MDDVCQVDEVKVEEVGRSSLGKNRRRNFRECWCSSCHFIANAFGKLVFRNCFALWLRFGSRSLE